MNGDIIFRLKIFSVLYLSLRFQLKFAHYNNYALRIKIIPVSVFSFFPLSVDKI